MKLIKTTIVFLCLLLGASCTLDLQQNPNTVDPSQAIPDLILNSIQNDFAGLFQGTSSIGMQMTRSQNSGGSTYGNVYNPNSFDGTWSNAYANIGTDAATLIAKADAEGLARHAGIARVLSAYTMLLMVDMFGDVPLSQSIGGSSNFNPSVDPGATVYTAAIAGLDKAILDLTTLSSAATPVPGYLSPVATIPQDVYYYSHVSGSYAKWVRLANTLKLKAFLNLRLTDPTAATSGINAAIAGGLITAQGDSFMFHYSNNASNPDARHPRFVANYPSGGGNYMSNWLMWQMFHGYNAVQQSGPGDPRMRFYFYRKVSTNNTDPNNIRCATNLLAPSHYPQVQSGAITINGAAGFPVGIANNPADLAWSTNGVGSAGDLPRTFCYPTDRGYWGRDHVDSQGIPPDNQLRSAWGVYPAGGRFDANVNQSTNSTRGMQGAGIQPIMMRAFTEFMLAEAVLYLPGIVGASSAAAHFQNGMQASFSDVRNFSENGTISGSGQPAGPVETSTINTFYPIANYNAHVAAYIASANAEFAAPTTPGYAGVDAQMNVLAREYWIALFGNGVEAYNLYRRTGFPSGMQPTLQVTTASSPFPRSHFYPQTFAALNSTVSQKTSLSQRVFWDTNTTNLDF